MDTDAREQSSGTEVKSTDTNGRRFPERRLISALLLALGVAAMVAGWQYGIFSIERAIGPGFVPAVAGAVIAVDGTIGLLGPTGNSTDRSRKDQPSAKALAVPAAILLLAVAVTFLIPYLGFLISAFGFILLTSFYLSQHTFRTSILLAFIGALVMSLVFIILLGVQMPLLPGSR